MDSLIGIYSFLMGVFVGAVHAANELSLPLRTHQAPKIDFICENSSFVAVRHKDM